MKTIKYNYLFEKLNSSRSRGSINDRYMDSSIMYNRYYNECQPIQCTYSYKTRNDLILIITALVGLVGGLTTSLKIVVPRLVKMIRKRKPGKTFHTSA